jgi:uroporphyrinogen-III synthase
VDLLTFTSSSAARSFAEGVTTDIGRAEVASIGPITSATIRELGWNVAIEAKPHTTAGLVATIVELYRSRTSRLE